MFGRPNGRSASTHAPTTDPTSTAAGKETMMPKLDAFTSAYIEAALWSTNDESDDSGGEPLDKNYGPEDIAPETMELIVEDCADFQERYAALLSESGITDDRAGLCFWLSREGHGSGYFDEDTIDEEFQDPLQEAAKSYGSFDLTVDDGVIYGPPADWYRKHHPRGVEEANRSHRSAHHMRSTPRPRYAGETKNIFWRDIPPGSKVELVGHSYVVTLPDGSRASAYWGGQDARAAQRALDGMVKAGRRSVQSQENATMGAVVSAVSGERHEQIAYEAGLADGLAWDLDGFDTWADVERAREGWDEATISAIGSEACRKAWGVAEGDNEAWDEACSAYNRGAYEGATTRKGRSGLPPTSERRGPRRQGPRRR